MEEEILGYTANGEPIHKTKPGMIYTQCIIACAACSKIIRGMGGPMQGALCVDCHTGIDQVADFDKFAKFAEEATHITRDAAGIIQNQGMDLSQDEINDWINSSAEALNNFMQRYRAHLRRVGVRLSRGLYK